MAMVEGGHEYFGYGSSSLQTTKYLSLRFATVRFSRIGDVFMSTVMVSNSFDSPVSCDLGIMVRNAELQGLFTYSSSSNQYKKLSGTEYRNKRGCSLVLQPKSQGVLYLKLKSINEGDMDVDILVVDRNSIENYDLLSSKIPVSQLFVNKTHRYANCVDVKNHYIHLKGDAPEAIETGSQTVSFTFYRTLSKKLIKQVFAINNYEFECTEQVASKILSLINVIELLSVDDLNNKDKHMNIKNRNFTFKNKTNSQSHDISELYQYLSCLIKSVFKRMKSDGSYGFWNKNSETHLYVTATVYKMLAACEGIISKIFTKNVELTEYTRIKNKTQSFIELMLDTDILDGQSKEASYAMKIHFLYLLVKSKVPIRNQTLIPNIIARKHNLNYESLAEVAVVLQSIANNSLVENPSNNDSLRPHLVEIMGKLEASLFNPFDPHQDPETSDLLCHSDDVTSPYEYKCLLLKSDIRTTAAIAEAFLHYEKEGVVKHFLVPKKLVFYLLRMSHEWKSTSSASKCVEAMLLYMHKFEAKEDTSFDLGMIIDYEGCLTNDLLMKHVLVDENLHSFVVDTFPEENIEFAISRHHNIKTKDKKHFNKDNTANSTFNDTSANKTKNLDNYVISSNTKDKEEESNKDKEIRELLNQADKERIEKDRLELEREQQQKNVNVPKGLLYYEIEHFYTLKPEYVKDYEHGFTLKENYFMKNKQPYVEEDGRIKLELNSHKIVRVKLHIFCSTARYHVAIVHHFSSCFEVVDYDTEDVYSEDTRGRTRNANGGHGTWFEHVNLRDDRVEIFANHLYAGSHIFEYDLRIISVGSFESSKLSAIEMYDEQINSYKVGVKFEVVR